MTQSAGYRFFQEVSPECNGTELGFGRAMISVSSPATARPARTSPTVYGRRMRRAIIATITAAPRRLMVWVSTVSIVPIDIAGIRRAGIRRKAASVGGFFHH